MDFSKLTIKELEETKNALNAEINKKREEEREQARKELENLLNRINELQDEYDFQISCEYLCEDWISSASNFKLEE